MIPIGKFGFVVLNIKMNPAKVDVNVHPAKLEVRFEEENKVFQAIYHTIKDTLLKDDLVANTEKTNIIIQNNDKIQSFDDLKSIEEKHSTGGLFGWKKKSKQIENYTNEESKIKTNIIEDLYMDKKQNETKLENNSEEKVDNLVDTSDVLNQLKNMQEKIKQEKENVEEKQDLKVMEETKENVEQKIPTGVNYTYFGENKEKVESLLRQLHPNIYNDTENKEEQTIENKQINEVKQEENNILKEENNKMETNNDNFIENKIQDNNNDIKENVVVNEQNDEEQGKKENEDSNYEITKKFKELKNQLDEQQSQITPEFKEMYQKLFGTKIEDKPKEEKEQQDNLDAVDIVKDNVSMFENIGTYQKPAYKFIGIVFKTYIIVEIDKEMYIIDQHAAHERIMYEKVKQNYYSQTNKDCQMLLLPDIITLSHKDMEIAKENFAMFNQAGFSLEEFGENTIKLTGVPTFCIDLDTKELFLETLDEINTVARTAKQEKEEKFIATVACKAAVKANMALSVEEVDSLMNKLLALPNPFTCPHGRPTAIKMTKYDIERKFARK
ncbi:dNA mismatch repair protein MutL [Clostridium sp. CAG:440]|mgnify:FL=1|nr:dNA mismatch repair protein MutL [Clostridium sp. CAG:440]